MTRIRLALAATAALALASGITLLPVLTSAPAASATPTCTGTSLVEGLNLSTLKVSSIRVPTSANGNKVYNCLLGPGNAGTAVSRLQIGLNDCNLHAGLAVDGIYGTATETAVKNAQSHYGIAADGVYGPQTAAVLRWPIAGSTAIICDVIF
jgi:peptidoglycan hydrolase-like protein with peptidoglycan-binding domain